MRFVMRENVINDLLTGKITAIVRGVYGKDASGLAEALCRGGIKLMELTFDQSDAKKRLETAELISGLRALTDGRMHIGAGTVIDTEQLNLARDAGAEFIISPDTNAEVINATREAGLVSIPGAFTPTEIMLAHRSGADFVKLFPSDFATPAYFKSVRAPLSNVRLLAVGGIDLGNMKAFSDAGAVGFGIGAALSDKKNIADGRFDLLEETARIYSSYALSL